MKRNLSLLAILVTVFWSFLAHASEEAVIETEHAEVELESEVSAIQPGKPFWLSLEFEMEPGWHIYWRNPGDSGLAAQMNWTLPEGFKTQDVHWPHPHRIEYEGLVNYGYEGIARLLIPVIPPEQLDANATHEFNVKASWLICKDICIPESGTATLTLGTNANEEAMLTDDAAGIHHTLEELPTLLKTEAFFAQEDKLITLALPNPEGLQASDIKSVYFYPYEGGVIDHAGIQSHNYDDHTLHVELPAGTQKAPDEGLSGVLEISLISGEMKGYVLTAQAGAIPPLSEEKNTDDNVDHLELALWQALLFAFLGGILLNAMPCVFPVLSLKALAITKKAAISPGVVKRQGFAYLLGVIASFLSLGALLIILKQSGEFVGWGFQLQSPAFITTLIYLFLLLGLSMSGMFELPIMFGSIGREDTESDSLSGSFFTGILAVLVATPCTVPFMAPAVGYAFAQSTSTTLLVMLVLGLGLAFPYLLISFFPPLRNALPRPGQWMITFKELMAFFLYATAAWLVWVLAQQASITGLLIVVETAVLLAFFIWLGKGKNLLMKMTLFTLALAAVTYSLISLHPEAKSTAQLESYGYTIEPFDANRLASLTKEGKPVFVNATAAWCITCKVNERVALRSQDVAQAFQEHNITYMVADWTNYDKPITQFLQKYERQGVPLYVFFPDNHQKPTVLPQLLTPSRVLHAIQGEPL